MASPGGARERIEARRVRESRTVQRPWQVWALTALWAIKGAEELLRGILGTGFYVYAQAMHGLLFGYALQVAIQSLLFSAVLTAGNFYVMGALWLGKRPARAWGVAFAMLSQIAVLAYLITRPPEGGARALRGGGEHRESGDHGVPALRPPPRRVSGKHAPRRLVVGAPPVTRQPSV
jgi:hypothetical protein